MAFTIAQYNALCEAISQGALSVKYADKEVQYRSLDDMYRVKRDMERELGLGSSGQPGRKYASFSRGL